MKVSDQFVLPADLQVAWAALADVDTIAACIPGMVIEKQTGPDSYVGLITVRFGPTKVIWRGKAEFVWDAAQHTVQIEARGADGRKASRAVASVSIALSGVQAEVRGQIEGDIEVSGPLSAFANSGGAHVLKTLLQDFEINFGRRLRPAAAADSTDIYSAGRVPSATASTLNGWNVARRAFASMLRGWITRLRARIKSARHSSKELT